jgi:hypothetical protein
MKSRSFPLIVVVGLLIVTGACKSPRMSVEVISAPSYATVGVPAATALHGAGSADLGFIVDWGDAVETTASIFKADTTVNVTHAWTDTGRFAVRARSYAATQPGMVSDWSDPCSVSVVSVHAPTVALLGVHPYWPCGESLVVVASVVDRQCPGFRLTLDWGDGTDTAVGGLTDSVALGFGHAYAQPDTYLITLSAQDTLGTVSPADSGSVWVRTEGTSIWSFTNSGMAEMSPTILYFDGTDSVCGFTNRDASCYYTVRLNSRGGAVYKDRLTASSWPVYCASTQSVITSVGSTLKSIGASSWSFSAGHSADWGLTAVDGRLIYSVRSDDSVVCVEDRDSAGVVVGTFGTPALMRGTVAVDDAGCVFVGSDSCWLHKLTSHLDSVLWSVKLGDRDIGAISFDDAGVVYCQAGPALVAVASSDGHVIWRATGPQEPGPVAVGEHAVYVGDLHERIFALDRATGAVIWCDTLEGQPVAAPLLTPDYLFAFSGLRLYCIRRADGFIRWWWAPGSGASPAGRDIVYYQSPSMTPNGDIIMPAFSAVCRVSGVPGQTPDAAAPWPKWQHDAYNSGCARQP